MIPGMCAIGSSRTAFLPTDLSTCEVWLDASDAGTVTLSGSNVTAWANKGSLGGSFTVSPYTSPTYATNVQNGLNAVDTSGAGGQQALRLTNQAVFKQVSGWTIFVVVKPGDNTPSLQNVFLSIGGAGGTTTRASVNIEPTTGFWRMGGRRLDADTFTSNTSSTQATIAAPSLITAIGDYSTTTATLRRNGSQIAQSTSWLTSGSTSNTNGQITFADNGGSAGFLKGRTYEIIGYSSALSSTDRDAVEAYLVQKWGL